MFCAKCGSPIQEGHKFCMQCGAPAPKIDIIQPQEAQQNTQQEITQPKKKRKTAVVVIIIVAVLFVIMAALLLVKIFVLDAASDEASDSGQGWSVVEDSQTEATLQDKDTGNLLRDKLDEIVDDKGDITEITRDKRRDRDVQDAEGVTGAIIQDISGDGVDDLVVVYAEEYCLYADVYTVDKDEVVQKGDHLLGLSGYAANMGDQALGGVYINETADGWILAADGWWLSYLFADGTCRDVKAVKCRDHSYETAADFNYAGSAPEESNFQHAREAAENIGMSVMDAPLDAPFFLFDQDVTAVCVFCDEADYIGADSYGDIPAGEEYGTFYSAGVTDENYAVDHEAFTGFIDDFQTYSAKYSQEQEEYYRLNSDFILPQSADTKLTAEDLKDIKDDEWLLKVARNEIFARYGRIFQDEELQEYFEGKDWYVPIYEPDEFDEYMVSDLEMSNAKFIKKYEDKLKKD